MNHPLTGTIIGTAIAWFVGFLRQERINEEACAEQALLEESNRALVSRVEALEARISALEAADPLKVERP